MIAPHLHHLHHLHFSLAPALRNLTPDQRIERAKQAAAKRWESSPYRVVRVDNGRENPHTGIVSQHRTMDAAQARIDRDNRILRRQPGYGTAWHPYAIEEYRDGQWDRV